MKPIIKWPGGKSTELDQFIPLVPDYDRYIEPFVGGGALYFALNPQEAVIGDTSGQLIELYQLLKKKDEELKRILLLYCSTFDALKRTVEKHLSSLLDLYAFYELSEKEKRDIRQVAPHLKLTHDIILDEAVVSELILDREEYIAIMETSVEDKLIRTARNNRKGSFTPKAIRDNIMTGFTGGYYLYFRSVFNQIQAKRAVCSKQYEIANFYFIREYCYGSMFRYNRKGEFNIPYGGISYNKKDMYQKVKAMFTRDVVSLLNRTDIYCEDFESLMKKLDLTERDFLFLDPPYDTEFSDYEGRAFDHSDQARLAEFLKNTKAQFILVIKNTEYIYSLYEGLFRILAFENQYVYNIRSRNDRKTEHLIITNIPEGQVPWIRENYVLDEE